MLRRRTKKNKSAKPEPIDPSTIPEAGRSSAAADASEAKTDPAGTAADVPATESEAGPDAADQVSPDTSDAIDAAAGPDLEPDPAGATSSGEAPATEPPLAEDLGPADVEPEDLESGDLETGAPGPDVAQDEVSEGRAASLPNVPTAPQDVPLDGTPPDPPEPPAAPAPPATTRRVPEPEPASALGAEERAARLPNVVPPAAVAAAASPAADERLPPPPADTPPGDAAPPTAQFHTESRAATLTGGIDLGGTKIAAAVIGPQHEVISYRRRPTPTTGGPSDVIKAMTITMQEAAQDAGVEAHQLRAVGVGSPGSVDSATGTVSGAGNLPGWDASFPMGPALRDALGTAVQVGNDVQVGTNAEYLLGAGAGYRSLLGVFWGTGVGGGIVLDGKPWRGRGRAGEIGHTLVKRGGAKGLNGLNGTVEAYAGRKAMQARAEREIRKGRKSDLFKLMEKHGKATLTSAIWSHARDHGDDLAIDLLDRAVRALSAGIASAVNLLDVEAVVIGGGLGVRFGDSLVPEIIEGMNAYLLDPDNPPAIKVAGLGDEGGVIGASLLVS